MAYGIKTHALPGITVECKWAFDLDPDAVETFNLNVSPVAQQGDVRQVKVQDLSDIDLFTFGFPCNDFSVVGEQLGIMGDYGPLYRRGINVLESKQPLAFIAENVSGLSSANEGETFKKILEEMSEAGPGYRIVPHLYSAEDYGVPQRRKRILIVGIRSDVACVFHPPAPSHEVPLTVGDALITNPVPADALNNELTRQSAAVIERLKYIKPGENAFNATMPDELRLNVSGAKISQIYRRLDPTKPAYTVTGSGGGGTHVYHWSENRALTNRERARLQSFPDDFAFKGSKESVRKQIGMAVPPTLARAVFEALIKALKGIEYDYVGQNIAFDGKRNKTTLPQPSFVYEEKVAY